MEIQSIAREVEMFDVQSSAGRVEFLFHEIWGWITGHCSLGGPDGSYGFSCEQDW